MLTVLENYRVLLVTRVRTILEWILKAYMNPGSVGSLHDIQAWFVVWSCYFATLFSFNKKKKDKKLLDWVRSRVDKIEVENFSSSWRSGVLLCALVDSIVPGSCPRYDLLNERNRLGNSQLAVQLLEKLSIKSCLTAQELADDDTDIEKPVKALLTQLRMTAAKRRLRNAVKSPFDDGPGSTLSNSEFFAKGMGLIFAVKGRRASFNIFRRCQRAFSFVIEIQGPDGTLGSALITHKSVRNQAINTELKRQLISESTKIVVDYSVTDEMISVFYTPVTSGKHTLNIVSQGQHILRSPYDISVDCNTTEVTAKVVETLFRPKKSALQKSDRRFSGTSLLAQRLQENKVAVPISHLGATGEVVARRVIKRTILNGDNSIVVPGDDERALIEALRDISNLNPKNREKLRQARSFVSRPVSKFRNEHRYHVMRTVSEDCETSSVVEESSVRTDNSFELLNFSEDQNQSTGVLGTRSNESKTKIATPLRSVPQRPRRLSLRTVGDLVNNQNQIPPTTPIEERCQSRDDNSICELSEIHHREFLMNERNATFDTTNENPYLPKSKSQRVRSGWDSILDKRQKDPIVDSRGNEGSSGGGHPGSDNDGDDRMSEIDGEVNALSLVPNIEKFTRFSPSTSLECSTSGSSNGSGASRPRTRTCGFTSGPRGNEYLQGY